MPLLILAAALLRLTLETGTVAAHRSTQSLPPTDASAMPSLTLDNGLTAVWEEDHRQPLVAIEARIGGGLRGEGALVGSGITHFIEHMLFKGTTSRPPGMIDQEVRQYGGTINAFTSHDFTGVSLFVESRFLPQALALLADILQHATFPEGEFAKERQVVVSEIQMNRDDPDRRLLQAFWNRQFLVHPYRHPILGYRELLERLTPEDLRGFYRTQYVPNNVTLTCVGDLDAAAMPELLRRQFGGWPRGSPYQIITPEEPPQLSLRESVEELPVQAAYVLLGFSSTRLAHEDLYVLDVLAGILGHGRSSRLYEALVRKQQLAQAVDASNYTPLDPGAFTIFFRTEPALSAQAKEAALSIVADVIREGVTAEELRKVKRQTIADYYFRHQTIESKAEDLASSMALTGDPAFSKRYVEGINRVTEKEVQAAAGRYLDPTRMTAVVIQPPRPAPTASASHVPTMPQITRVTFDNGLTVLMGVDRHLPIGSIVLVSRGGVRVEDDTTQGLSHLVAQMLVKGTTRRSASAIAEFVESLGGGLEPFSGRDGFGLSMHLLAEDMDQGLELIHELVTESDFPEEALSLQRQLILHELVARDDDIFDVAGRLLRRTVFVTHPYRFDPMGTADTVKGFTREACRDFAKEWLVPRNMVLAVVGDLDERVVLETIQRRFGRLADQPARWPSQLEETGRDGIRRASLVLPKEQSVILLGFPGTRLTDPDRDAVDVLTAVLSGMSGRLFQAVREQQGLSYTLGATHTPGWDRGYVVVYAATKPEERERVLKTMEEQLQAVSRLTPTDEELDQAKRYLIGLHRMSLQAVTGLARRAALDELYGVGYDAWASYEERINTVTREMIREAAECYLQLPHRAEVLVGPNGTQEGR
ncbi:MAG: insulinase family protein [Candidatus Omnitrophica bacterium]|nr:insulinase family protein [Candidatus Omnitrophota bacterium]